MHGTPEGGPRQGRQTFERLVLLGFALALVLGAWVMSSSAGSVAASNSVGGGQAKVRRATPVAAEKPAGTIGSAACAGCHAEVATAFARTPHGRAPGWDDAHGCESCHGPGLPHISDVTDKAAMPRLGALSPSEASKPCAACHEGSDFASASHDGLDDVSCTSCHAAHGSREALLRAPESELCSSCHSAVAAQFALPRSHPMSRESGCTSCHPAHGGRVATAASSSDTCTAACHVTQRGPYIYPHDIGLVDGCTSCHEPHGSTNRHLLKHQRQVDLCYSCHPGASTPTFHSFGRFVGEKCTACHTAIHGSNSSPTFLEE